MVGNLEKILVGSALLAFLSFGNSHPQIHVSVAKNNSSQISVSEKLGKPKPKILIDAGHNEKTVGTSGKAGVEYQLTEKMAYMLNEFFVQSGEFETELTREGPYYRKEILEIKNTNQELMNTLAYSSPVTKDSLSPKNRMDLYSIIKYAEEKGFDLIFSIHVNSSSNGRGHNFDNGYHTIVSPINAQYEKSRNTALQIYSELSKSDEAKTKYKVSKTISHDSGVGLNTHEADYLRRRGIVLRKKLIVPGSEPAAKYGGNTKVASMIFETGNIKDPNLVNDDYLRDLMSGVYNGIKKAFEKESIQSARN